MTVPGGGGAEQSITLVRDLGRVPETLRRRLGATLRSVAEPIAADARSRASWSTRIPGAISTSARFTGRRPGVSVRVSRSAAPHARAYEGLTGDGSTFRHPVFGRDVWVTRSTRPFLAPAARAGSEAAFAAVSAAVDESARAHGWR